MQRQGIFIFFFIFFILPVIIVFSNHDAFFIVMSLILFITSLRNIHMKIFKSKNSEEPESTELLEQEIEDNINIDIRKLSLGSKISKSLFAILFFMYSSFYIPALWLKMLNTLVILYWFHVIASNLAQEKKSSIVITNKNFLGFMEFFISVFSIVLISVSFVNKFVS